MMEQLRSREEAKGRTVRELTYLDGRALFLITFTDNTFLCFETEFGRDDYRYITVRTVQPASMSIDFIRAGVITEDELEAARKQAETNRLAREKAARHARWLALKAEFEGEQK